MLKGKVILLLLTILVISILVGCAPAPESAPTIQPTPLPSAAPATATPQPSASPMKTPTSSTKDNTPMSTTPAPAPTGPEPAPVLEAKQDLAKRLSINSSGIELVSFESVTWPDGSLGCPQPGMMYTQMLVDGYRIQLRASGRVYEYHGPRTGGPFLCGNPK